MFHFAHSLKRYKSELNLQNLNSPARKNRKYVQYLVKVHFGRLFMNLYAIIGKVGECLENDSISSLIDTSILAS